MLISTNAGWNATIGHNEGADGGWMNPGAFFLSTLEYPYPQREVEFNRIGTEIAWDYARSHPLREVELSFKKTYRLWKSDGDAVTLQDLNINPSFLGTGERRTPRVVTNSFYYAVLVFAAVGAAGTWSEHRRWWVLLLILAAGWTALHVALFGENRFHYPLSPFLSLAAALGIMAAPAYFGKVRTYVALRLGGKQRSRAEEQRQARARKG